MLAIETLSWMETQKLSERLALSKTVKQLEISNPNAAKIAHQLVYETTRRRNMIDRLINNVVKPKTVTEFSIGVQAFLRLYVYQTRFAKGSSRLDLEEAERVAGLGRAILGWRKLTDTEPILGFLLTREIEPLIDVASDEGRVGLRTFFPTWFVKYCFHLFGRNDALSFLEGSFCPPPTFIRTNTLRASENSILRKLEGESLELEKVEPLKHVYKVIGRKHASLSSPSYREGLFYIQDKASCFAAEAADPLPGQHVLDVCAAPGAKTTYLAQLMQNQGVIESVDYSARRFDAWRKEVLRMGVSIADGVIADASVSLPFEGTADLVVLDPPCTSTGVFGKIPSAKWRLGKRSIERMASIQWRMIDKCCENVTSGGTLVYATCSITEEENEIIIERFLKWHPDFALTDVHPQVGVPGLRGLVKCQRLYPHIHQSNGFFIAKLIKQ
jgi:16S rRNA (cytosine967-C5)-methyltransferase